MNEITLPLVSSGCLGSSAILMFWMAFRSLWKKSYRPSKWLQAATLILYLLGILALFALTRLPARNTRAVLLF